MKNATRLPTILALGAAGILFLSLASPAAAQFTDRFDAATLDPAWEVRPYDGALPRCHGYTSLTNDYSLTANPGNLRYTLTPMNHFEGFLNGYQRIVSGSNCYDPALELHRTFGGVYWVFEAKGTYYMPYSNGRAFDLRVVFGDGSPGTFFVGFGRHRDGNYDDMYVTFRELLGLDATNHPIFDYLYHQPLYNNPPMTWSTYYYRLERVGGVLTASWSSDGTTWNVMFSSDMGTALDGLGQRVIVAGNSWHYNGGSFADFDYISVTVPDDDADGVTDALDACPGTVIPEGVPTRELKPNHWALVDADHQFDSRGRTPPKRTYTTDDTGGCSCEQIIDAMHLGAGLEKFGCPNGVMDEWKALLSGASKGVAGAQTYDTGSEIPDGYELEGNYPNPFNGTTTIVFTTPESAPVRLTVYDLLGRERGLLVDGVLPSGRHEVTFETEGLPSGLYVVRFVNPAGSIVRTLTLAR